MLKDALELIHETARRADGIYDCGVEPSHVYFTRRPDGGLERHEAEPGPVAYRFFTLDDFAKGVRDLGGADVGKRGAVFAGRGAVVAVLDEGGDRRDRLSMELPQSHEFRGLARLGENRTIFKHDAFIRLLRVDLAGCLEDGVLATFRNVKHENNQAGASVVGTGKESVSLDVRRNLLFDGKDAPDEITVSVHVYRDLPDLFDDDARVPIRCVVEVDVLAPAFTLIPLAGECERAQRDTDSRIQEKLRDALPEGMRVLCGKV
jgi:hypothetical protein